MNNEAHLSKSAAVVDEALSKLYEERSIIFPKSVVGALMIASLGARVLGEDPKQVVGILVQSLVEPVTPLLEAPVVGEKKDSATLEKVRQWFVERRSLEDLIGILSGGDKQVEGDAE